MAATLIANNSATTTTTNNTLDISMLFVVSWHKMHFMCRLLGLNFLLLNGTRSEEIYSNGIFVAVGVVL